MTIERHRPLLDDLISQFDLEMPSKPEILRQDDVDENSVSTSNQTFILLTGLAPRVTEQKLQNALRNYGATHVSIVYANGRASGRAVVQFELDTDETVDALLKQLAVIVVNDKPLCAEPVPHVAVSDILKASR